MGVSSGFGTVIRVWAVVFWGFAEKGQAESNEQGQEEVIRPS